MRRYFFWLPLAAGQIAGMACASSRQRDARSNSKLLSATHALKQGEQACEAARLRNQIVNFERRNLVKHHLIVLAEHDSDRLASLIDDQNVDRHLQHSVISIRKPLDE
jgi:hypothetical protein